MTSTELPDNVTTAAGTLIGEESDHMLSAGYFDEWTMAGALDQAGLLATDWTVTRRIEAVIRRMESDEYPEVEYTRINGEKVDVSYRGGASATLRAERRRWAKELRKAIATDEEPRANP